MAGNIDELVASTLASINKLKAKGGMLRKPIEERTLPDMLDVMDYVITSVEGIAAIVKLEGVIIQGELNKNPAYYAGLRSPEWLYETLVASQTGFLNTECLQAAESFYTQMMARGYYAVGSLIKALRQHQVPEDAVKQAAKNAYFHKPLREAIRTGYGIVPLEPPKPSPQKPI